jgi:hypothetical protein
MMYKMFNDFRENDSIKVLNRFVIKKIATNEVYAFGIVA